MVTPLISLLLFVAHLSGDASTKAFKKLKTLEGTWQRTLSEGHYYEEWNEQVENSMHGIAYRVTGNDTVELEKLQLLLANEELLYIATVPNQNDAQPVTFLLTEFSSTIFTFENPAHDFPKRIIYHLATQDSLYVFIDSGVDSRKIEFYFKRIK